ncbi:7582_t:CDS:2, partial [Scutellospora calospora]
TSCSFAGDIPFKAPTSIGNYEYPKGINIPENFTIPAGNVFKFVVYTGGYIWYKCNNNNWVADDYRNLYFNHKEDLANYPTSAVAAVRLE